MSSEEKELTSEEIYAKQKTKGQTRWAYDQKAKAKARLLTEWPLVMNTTQLAGILDLQSRTLIEWRKRGVGPDWFTTIGTRAYYRKEDVLDWIEECKQDNQAYLDEVAQFGKKAGYIKRAKKRFYANSKEGRARKAKKKKATGSAHLVFRQDK